MGLSVSLEFQSLIRMFGTDDITVICEHGTKGVEIRMNLDNFIHFGNRMYTSKQLKVVKEKMYGKANKI